MAFTLVINSKGLFGKVKSIQMAELLKNCGLKYGSNNELAKEIERQFKKASFYCTEEKRNYTEYYVAAEPPVRCGESHPSGQTEPPCY